MLTICNFLSPSIMMSHKQDQCRTEAARLSNELGRCHCETNLWKIIFKKQLAALLTVVEKLLNPQTRLDSVRL